MHKNCVSSKFKYRFYGKGWHHFTVASIHELLMFLPRSNPANSDDNKFILWWRTFCVLYGGDNVGILNFGTWQNAKLEDDIAPKKSEKYFFYESNLDLKLQKLQDNFQEGLGSRKIPKSENCQNTPHEPFLLISQIHSLPRKDRFRKNTSHMRIKFSLLFSLQ